ncbi:hypothetical protein AB0368_06700 [Actinoplanes sp. NPDC051475]|uniref:hypothetical protein n=1 Tax=Actinoplanes sp. NPDC051475 TaxID=3157225 RepID=UPI00344B6F12
MTGPLDACQRSTCAGEATHPGGVHLDPTHRLYDGPDISLRALPSAVREPAIALLHAARRDSWNLTAVHMALHRLAREIHRLQAQVAAVQVDRDRSVRAAIARAEDCAEHGPDLRYEQHQAYWFSRLVEAKDAERVVWLSAVHDINRALTGRSDDWAAALRAHLAQIQRQAAKTRAGGDAPTLADCQRAGRCEHPPTDPHVACQQLTAVPRDAEPEHTSG